MTRYLVRPICNANSDLTGDELSDHVNTLLQKEKSFLNLIHLDLYPQEPGDENWGAKGSAVAFYLSRAQHETIKYQAPGVGDEYLTVVSIALSMDIFSDRAAQKKQLRLESIFSKLLVGEQPVITETPLSENRLKSVYSQLFKKTLKELVNQAKDELKWERDRAKAVFQFNEFVIPKMSKELSQLIENAMASQGQGNAKKALDWETERLKLELLHTLHQFVSKNLREKGVLDIALMSPPTPWAQGDVGEVLKNRLVGRKRAKQTSIRFYVDPTMEQGGTFRIGGKSAVLGYTVRAVLPRACTSKVEGNKLVTQNQLTTQLAARIYRPVPGGKPKWMPVTVEKEKRTAISYGYKVFNNIKGMQRPTTRELMMDSFRNAAIDISPHLIGLMQEIAANRLENR
ncbi:hypothetical protein [uncultured Desulfobacter sp.]|uniref:hypothetical protein n=1 Tax=uncultured Desulfobacter sp. TaxID=240139 RepID=UPI002AAB1F72|nr:hypothetical protein [uncultured Desulfobacter sp.]